MKSLNPRLAAALLANNAAGFVTHFAVAAIAAASGYSAYAATLSVASLLGVVHLAMQNNAQHSTLDGASQHRRSALVLSVAVGAMVVLSARWWAQSLDLPVAGAALAVVTYFFSAAYASTVRGEVMARDPQVAARLMTQSAVFRVAGATACAAWHPVAGVVGLGAGELIPALLHRLKRDTVERRDERGGTGVCAGPALVVSVLSHVGVFVAFYAPVFAARARLGEAAAAGFAFSSALVGGQLSLAYATAWPAVNSGSDAWASALKAGVVSLLVGVPVTAVVVVAPKVLGFEPIGVLGAGLLAMSAVVAAPAIVLFQVLLRARLGGRITWWLSLTASGVVVLSLRCHTQRELALVTMTGSLLMLVGLAWIARSSTRQRRGGVCHVVTQRFDRHEAVCKTVVAIASELGADQFVVAPGAEFAAERAMGAPLWAPVSPLWPKVRRLMRASDVVVVHGGPLSGLTAMCAPRGRIVVHVYASMRPDGGGWRQSRRTKAGPVRAVLSATFGWPLLRVLLRVGKVSHVVCASEDIAANLRGAEGVSVVCVAPVDAEQPQAEQPGAEQPRAAWAAVPHLFFAGRAEMTRGVRDVIEVVAELRRRGVAAGATVAVRAGRDLEEVTRVAEETPGVVLLAGDSERLMEEMRRATIGVWPFRTEATVTPATTTVEAAMAGLPVVSSTVGCCAVVACERVPVGDVMALADAVERVHSSKGAWDEAARRSRVAAEGLAVRRHAELLDETYRGGTNCSTLGALRGAVALEEEN